MIFHSCFCLLSAWMGLSATWWNFSWRKLRGHGSLYDTQEAPCCCIAIYSCRRTLDEVYHYRYPVCAIQQHGCCRSTFSLSLGFSEESIGGLYRITISHDGTLILGWLYLEVRSLSSIISETIDMIYSRYEKTILYLQAGTCRSSWQAIRMIQTTEFIWYQWIRVLYFYLISSLETNKAS